MRPEKGKKWHKSREYSKDEFPEARRETCDSVESDGSDKESVTEQDPEEVIQERGNV